MLKRCIRAAWKEADSVYVRLKGFGKGSRDKRALEMPFLSFLPLMSRSRALYSIFEGERAFAVDLDEVINVVSVQAVRDGRYGSQETVKGI
eukprot:m.215108 g.215108  ORF g.215108 m.215108 type:complete len:91 (+) comp39823_c0_seq1:568-840(+)